MVSEPLTNSDDTCENRSKLARLDARPVEWVISAAPVPYPEALSAMKARAAAIAAGEAEEAVWLLEHPPLYTAGTSAQPADLLSDRFPVFDAGRGGQYTYHGPGQRVAYLMLDLKRRRQDVRAFVQALEEWIIRALARHGMVGSMGQVGSAGDNAAMESFFALLQKNVLDRRSWATRDDLRIEIITWIERTYHRRRRQDALSRLTPTEYESIMTPQTALAA